MRPEEEIKETYRDHLSTVDESGKRKWIFPKKPSGSYYTKRTIVAVFFYTIFFALPFIRVGGKPIFLFNILEGEYIFFGKIFWPQDFLVFGLMMLSALLFIALFTLAFGRVFCGWVCPQTVFLELLFRRIDYWILGDSPAQRKLYKQAWDNEKIRKYTIRYIIYFIVSFIIANTFLSYIIGVDELWKIITEPVSMHIGGFIGILVFTGLFFGVFAFLREQVCTNICPYGRLQGVLLDKDSVVVTYDHERGEPRGKYAKTRNDALGDCIDCNQCVVVCPTGIDIRNGTQLECTNCTACIDACNFMMEKVGYPKGLIRYDSENNITNKKTFKITNRIMLISAALVAIIIFMSGMIINQKDIGVKILRSSGLTYQERGADSLSNLYTVSLENKTNDTLEITFKLHDLPGKIELVGGNKMHLLPANRAQSSFFVVLPKSVIKERKNEIAIDLYENGELIQTKATTFLAPVKIRQ